MVDNEMLLAISNLMDEKLRTQLEPIRRDIRELKDEMKEVKADIQKMKTDIQKIQICQETNILPRLQNIEGCYLSTFERYQEGTTADLTALASDMAGENEYG